MNSNDISFGMHVEALRTNLVESLRNNSYQMFVHLSHDDLDGCGCTVITYLQQWYLQRNLDHDQYPHTVTANYIFKND